MSTRDEYVRKMHSMLDKLNGEIDTLSTRAGQVETDMRDEYRKQIDALRARQQEARAKLESLRDAGEDAWEDFKAGVDLAREAIAEAIESARSRFHK